jgi:hypothetical protein
MTFMSWWVRREWSHLASGKERTENKEGKHIF